VRGRENAADPAATCLNRHADSSWTGGRTVAGIFQQQHANLPLARSSSAELFHCRARESKPLLAGCRACVSAAATLLLASLDLPGQHPRVLLPPSVAALATTTVATVSAGATEIEQLALTLELWHVSYLPDDWNHIVALRDGRRERRYCRRFTLINAVAVRNIV